jgi:hypothetical protein
MAVLSLPLRDVLIAILRDTWPRIVRKESYLPHVIIVANLDTLESYVPQLETERVSFVKALVM